MRGAVSDWMRGDTDARVVADAAARQRATPLRTILIAAGVAVAILFVGVAIRIGMHQDVATPGVGLMESGEPGRT